MVYQTRQKRLLAYIQQALHTDTAFMMVPNNIYYFTGFAADPHERFFALYMDAKQGKTTLFVPALDESAAAIAEVDHIIPVSDTEDPYKKFAQTIGDAPSKVAIEKSYITIMQMQQLEKQFPTLTFNNMESLIATMRAQKTPTEIEHIRQAVAISEQALQTTWNKIQPGMTELEIKAELEYQMTILGADAIAFETIVLSGKRAALPHGSAGNTVVKKGDFLLFDFGVTKNGYHSDLTRTCIVGEGTNEQEKIYHTVRHANERAIAAVKMGATLQIIDQAARHYIEEKGYGEYFTHRIGHGLGLDVHEYPSIHHENTDIIQQGLLFTIEPGIYVPDIGGVRIEDDLYVHPNGQIEVLSTFTKDLIYV